ncbi:LacI family transcriptional regulator [Streptomyces sp. V4I8]|uniref:substrate-binding domain-containing protein n=1 Tax=Streptomyces sp. V4I8 TaxID=3156469 RepID=UPI0035181EEF
MEQEATSRGRLSLVCFTHGDVARENDLVQLMREQHAAAVVLVGGVVPADAYYRRMAEYAKALDAAGSRLVLAGRPPLPMGSPATVVEFDNRGGAFRATSHLLAAGYRRILFLGREPGLSGADQRRGVAALRAHAAADEAELYLRGSVHPHLGLPAGAGRPGRQPGLHAVHAGTDTIAVGALAALREAGLRVPRDVSVVGFDDVPYATDLTPSLTTVRGPYEELGRTAVRLAVDREESVGADDLGSPQPSFSFNSGQGLDEGSRNGDFGTPNHAPTPLVTCAIEPMITAWKRGRVARSATGDPGDCDLRDAVNAIFYQNRTGCQWRYAS